VATNKRIYVVGTDERLVRAANAVQARNHVAKATIGVRVASQEDLVKLAGSRKVEEAVDDPHTAPLPLGTDNT
jgi:hypothetical protein